MAKKNKAKLNADAKKDEVVNEILGTEVTEGEEYNFYTEAQKRSEALAEVDRSLTKEEKAALLADARKRFTNGG